MPHNVHAKYHNNTLITTSSTHIHSWIRGWRDIVNSQIELWNKELKNPKIHNITWILVCIYGSFTTSRHLPSTRSQVHISLKWQKAITVLGKIIHILANYHQHRVTNSLEQSPSWEANSQAAYKKFPIFYGSQKLITVFIRAYQWSL
jgi:hypothetical protein